MSQLLFLILLFDFTDIALVIPELKPMLAMSLPKSSLSQHFYFYNILFILQLFKIIKGNNYAR